MSGLIKVDLVYGAERHFQQYFSHIVAVSFIGGGKGVPGENHRSVASHRKTVSHNVVSITHRHERDSNTQR